MAGRKGFWRRRADTSSGAIEPIRVGDVLPSAPEENARQVADRVKAIIAAAEENAAEIERFAHADAERIRAEAVAEGEAHIERVRESTAAIERRAGAMEEAIAEIISGLGRGAAQLDRELAEAVAAPALAASESGDVLAPGSDSESGVDNEDVENEGVDNEDVDNEGVENEGVDNEGARLVALDLALEGRDRDEAAAELAEHYPGVEVEPILEEVYAQFGPPETPPDDQG